MPYQRDNFLHFLMYCAGHTFLCHIELPYYAIKTQRYDVAVQAVLSDVFYMGMVHYLNCINHIENLYTFNDGYHIVHHINSRIHWAEMPQRFLKELPKYAQEGAITFSGLHFFQVGLYVMTGQWSALAKAYVHLTDSPMSDEEVIKMLKSRLVPCTVPDSNDKKVS